MVLDVVDWIVCSVARLGSAEDLKADTFLGPVQLKRRLAGEVNHETSAKEHPSHRCHALSTNGASQACVTERDI